MVCTQSKTKQGRRLLQCIELSSQDLVMDIHQIQEFYLPILATGSDVSCQAAVVEFEAIPSDDINVEIESLGTDQKYLLKIYRTVTTGVCPRDLSHQQPGKIYITPCG